MAEVRAMRGRMRLFDLRLSLSRLNCCVICSYCLHKVMGSSVAEEAEKACAWWTAWCPLLLTVSVPSLGDCREEKTGKGCVQISFLDSSTATLGPKWREKGLFHSALKYTAPHYDCQGISVTLGWATNCPGCQCQWIPIRAMSPKGLLSSDTGGQSGSWWVWWTVFVYFCSLMRY